MRLPRTKEWREARGLSQRELSAEAGVGESTVPRIERGESVTPPTARKIADALGVSVSDLLESPPVPLASAPSASLSPDGEPDETGQEEKRRERELITLIDLFVEREAGLEGLEEILKTAAANESVPLARVGVYAENRNALRISYEEIASNRGVSKRLEEAERRLGALDARINALFGQLWSPGDAEQLRSLGKFARARITHSGEAVEEANAGTEADAS
jgi:transcriptional regulator with XRE-family HTH domain